MKTKATIIFALITLFSSFQLLAADQFKTEKDKVSYSIGLNIGQSFITQGIDIDPKILAKGIEDALNQREPAMTQDEIKATMDAFQQQMAEKAKQQNQASADINLAKGEAFLKENGKKEGIITTASGLQYQVIKEGSGKTPTINDTVETNYEGSLINGTVFDSSYKRGKTISFPVNGVIRGWTEALQLMKTGAKWKLFIPARLAYGERGAGNVIGPNETLIFDIELLEVK